MTISRADEASPGRPVPRFDWRRLHHWLAYGAGSGLSPWAPGTAGTLAAIPLYLLVAPLSLSAYLVVLVVFFAVGVWACDKTARELGTDDPAPVVWDEVVGLLVTMVAAPAGWLWLVVGFLLFRLFDILKPWPIRVLDRDLRGGLGIMLDDVAAGLMAWAVLQALHWLVG